MKQDKIKIAIVTVNFNNTADTIACIRSFAKINTRHDLRFYVVNNGCTDETQFLIAKNLESTTIINSKANLGFSGGNNLGIRKALKDGCTHLLLINNDAEINSKNFFDQLLASPYDITSTVIHTNSKSDYGGKVDWYFGRNTHRHTKGEIDYVSGACLFAKSEIFKTVGDLDERFFLYYEDVDFCLRARNLGYTIGVASEVSIKHKLSASTNKLGYKKTSFLAQSHLLFCQKHLSIFFLPLYLIFNIYLRISAFFPKKA